MIAAVWLMLSGLMYSLQLSTGSFPKPLTDEEEKYYLARSAQGDLEADNHVELEQVQQDIITIQEDVLALHKAQQQDAASEMDYEIKIASYSQQMDELQKRQQELKATAGRFTEVKYWRDAFKEHVRSGEKMDTSDAVVLRQLTNRIVVYDDRLEIHLRSGCTLEHTYTR